MVARMTARTCMAPFVVGLTPQHGPAREARQRQDARPATSPEAARSAHLPTEGPQQMSSYRPSCQRYIKYSKRSAPESLSELRRRSESGKNNEAGVVTGAVVPRPPYGAFS